MEINVKLFGTLRTRHQDYDHGAGIVLKPSRQIKVREVIEQLGLPEDQVGIVTIDGKLAKADNFVPDGSEIKVFQPLAGG